MLSMILCMNDPLTERITIFLVMDITKKIIIIAMCSQRSNCAPAARELHAVLELFCKGLGVWVPTVVVVHATFIEVFFKIQVSWGPQKELGANPRQFEH
jgi:hypothetical protein